MLINYFLLNKKVLNFKEINQMNQKRNLIAILSLCFIMIMSCIPVFASEQVTLQGGVSITLYTQQEAIDDDITEYEKAGSLTLEDGSHPSSKMYYSKADKTKVQKSKEAVNALNAIGTDKTVKSALEDSKKNLNEMATFMRDFAPDFSAASGIMLIFQNPINTALGVLYGLAIIIFLFIEGYNFFLIIKDGAYDEGGAGATSTDGGAPNNISAFLNRFISRNTKKCLQMEEGRLGKWFMGEAVKFIAIAFMIALLVSGLFFSLLASAGQLIGKFFGN